jgi:hypothetical protein
MCQKDHRRHAKQNPPTTGKTYLLVDESEEELYLLQTVSFGPHHPPCFPRRSPWSRLTLQIRGGHVQIGRVLKCVIHHDGVTWDDIPAIEEGRECVCVVFPFQVHHVLPPPLPRAVHLQLVGSLPARKKSRFIPNELARQRAKVVSSHEFVSPHPIIISHSHTQRANAPDRRERKQTNRFFFGVKVKMSISGIFFNKLSNIITKERLVNIFIFLETPSCETKLVQKSTLGNTEDFTWLTSTQRSLPPTPQRKTAH